jgi:hypothetical protein
MFLSCSARNNYPLDLLNNVFIWCLQLDVPVFSKPHVKSMTMQKRPASNDDCTSYAQKVKISCTHDI